MAPRHLAAALAVPTLALGVALAPAGVALAETGSFTASAVGANEPDGGHPSATAEGSFRVDTAAGEFCYTVSAKGLDDAAAMHIHEEVEGKNGPVVIPLDHTKIGAGETCTTAKSALLEGIVAEPGDYYLNIHTPEFPAGAVRDQLAATTPESVDAGSGGQAGGGGVPLAPLGVITLGVAVMGAAGWRLARR